MRQKTELHGTYIGMKCKLLVTFIHLYMLIPTCPVPMEGTQTWLRKILKEGIQGYAATLGL